MAEKGCILLIDDDPNMALIAEKVFSRAGYRFRSVETGSEAFRVLGEEMPDLVVLDYMLPDMDGEEFLLRYQRLGPDRPPVMMLTCRADKNDRVEEYFELGLSAFLVKPFGHRELVSVAENLILRWRLERRGEGGSRSVTGQAADVLWGELEDLAETARSIEALAFNLLSGSDGELSDRQKVSVTAIYNGTRRLSRSLQRLKERTGSGNGTSVLTELELGS